MTSEASAHLPSPVSVEIQIMKPEWEAGVTVSNDSRCISSTFSKYKEDKSYIQMAQLLSVNISVFERAQCLFVCLFICLFIYLFS